MIAPPEPTAHGLVAPRWHTALLVGLYLSVALAGTLLQGHGAPTSALPGDHGRVVARYLPLLLVQWGITFYVSRVGRPASALRGLLGAPWTSARRVGSDLALAAVGHGLIKATELAWSSAGAGDAASSVSVLLPQGVGEGLWWVVVAASVGFCEEVVFWGYLLRQFEAFTGRPWVAVALQAALFGLAHGEQGLSAVVRIAVYGLGFGALARWRRSLAPGIACHVWTNLASGLRRS